jgi:hypothetical protein
LVREECRRSRQGKEVGDRRCGKAIEAKPSSGQIKPTRGQVAAIEHGGLGRTSLFPNL